MDGRIDQVPGHPNNRNNRILNNRHPDKDPNPNSNPNSKPNPNS